MSRLPDLEPEHQDPARQEPGPRGPVETVVVPRIRDIGGFEVRRALPTPRRQMVGPFIFWDQMGPAALGPGTGLEVRPHPHIGLATLTYLFEGDVVHRDSLGNEIPIRPGAVNWMLAGRGIVHSERTDPAIRATGGRIAGIQSWVALPEAVEEAPPAFAHVPADALPTVEGEGKHVRIIAGRLWGLESPLATASDTLYADATLAARALLPVDDDAEERAIYVYDGTIAIERDVYEAGRLLVLRPGEAASIRALSPARLLILGGTALEGPRHIWWNFVSSSRDRIEAAKADWKERRFPLVPGDETEFVPLPER